MVTRRAFCRYLLLPCFAEPGNQYHKRATDHSRECSFIKLAQTLTFDNDEMLTDGESPPNTETVD